MANNNGLLELREEYDHFLRQEVRLVFVFCFLAFLLFEYRFLISQPKNNHSATITSIVSVQQLMTTHTEVTV